MKIFPCGLCHGEDFAFLYEQKDRNDQPIHVTVCNRCGLTQLNPRRDEEEEAKFYSADFYQLHGLHKKREKSKRWIARKGRIAAGILDAVEKHRPLEGARLLDVGCGHGFLLRQARERGARVAGVEPDPKAAASLREEGFEVFNGSLQDFSQKAAGVYDVVTISHVVEHVNQPIPFLEAGAALLRPDGLLAAEVPNLTWHLDEGRHPFAAHSAHVYYHSESTLRALFEVSGLGVQSVSFGMGGRTVCAVGTPTPASALAELPLEDPVGIRDSHDRAVRRLRSQWGKRLVRAVKRRVRELRET